MSGERFKAYPDGHLIKELKKGDVVVMDNLPAHRIKDVAAMICNAGATLLYLPPYSPDLNPVEHLWSKVKSIVRKLRPRNLEDLATAMHTALGQVSAKDCEGWFSNCGYSI
jgi:transposase